MIPGASGSEITKIPHMDEVLRRRTLTEYRPEHKLNRDSGVRHSPRSSEPRLKEKPRCRHGGAKYKIDAAGSAKLEDGDHVNQRRSTKAKCLYRLCRISHRRASRPRDCSPGRTRRRIRRLTRRISACGETDCVAGLRGLELRYPCASHVFEIL